MKSHTSLCPHIKACKKILECKQSPPLSSTVFSFPHLSFLSPFLFDMNDCAVTDLLHCTVKDAYSCKGIGIYCKLFHELHFLI